MARLDLFSAISAAAAELQNATSESSIAKSASVKPDKAPKPKVQPKSPADAIREAAEAVMPKAANGANGRSKPAQPTKPTNAAKPSDTPKTKGGAKYVIPASFKQAIEKYLQGRSDMKSKLSAKGKSIDGCCDYIFDVMRKRAEKERGGKSAVGLYADPQEIFGMAVHYYDETDESLKEELNAKEK
ncbi:MAG: hypothetical protein IKX61_01290 [Prevotella sp.]|nr:hypothetical protein [Prevotella sp.]